MALSPLRDRRDDVTVGDVVTVLLLIAALVVGVVDVSIEREEHADEINHWRSRAAACEASP